MRQRIVIDLEAPKTEAAKPAGKRRRWVRVLGILALFLLLVVVAAAVAGFLVLRRYQSTPAYTLALMLDAAQRNDVAEFQERIDEEEIMRNMRTSVSQKAAARYGYALNSSIQQQIDSAVPSLLAGAEQTVQNEMFNAIQAFARAPHRRSFISILGVVESLLTVTTDGDSASATGKMAGHNLELVMRRDGNRWKVTEVKDDLILQRVVDSLMTQLPAIGNIDANSPLLKQPQRRARRGR